MLKWFENINWLSLFKFALIGWLVCAPEKVKTSSPEPKIRMFNIGKVIETGKPFYIDPKDFEDSGERDIILASSGMGKSWTGGVLVEEILENDGIICAIDPESEYPTLATRYKNMLIIGGDSDNAIEFERDSIPEYITDMFKHGLSLIWDLSDYPQSEQQELYTLISRELFQQQLEYSRQIIFVVEEADVFAPQSAGASDSKLESAKTAKRGRKKGINSLWITQRPSVLNKDVLSQGNRFWFGGMSEANDIKKVLPYLIDAGITEAQIKALKPGQFYVYAKGKYTVLVNPRKRYCKHTAKTPKFDPNAKIATQEETEAVLDKYRKRKMTG